MNAWMNAWTNAWSSSAGPFFATVLPGEALAYIGPGAGLSALGALLALIGVVFLAIVGFIWYPVKRILRRRKSSRSNKSKAGP